MTIKIQTGRQFAATETDVAVFDAKGKAGTYLQKASEKLIANEVTLQLKGTRSNTTYTLKTAAQWKAFLERYASSKEAAEKLPGRFGITFSDFVNTVDDLAASDDKGMTVDLKPNSAVAKALSLDKIDGDYAGKMAPGATIDLTGAAGTTVKMESVGVARIGPEILATPITSDWERDRSEQESWADFKWGNGAGGRFREFTGPKPFEKLHEPKWDDPAAMALVERFALPLHLEVSRTNPDGTPRFQDGSEMFRDTYFDDKNGSLEKAGATVRARVRFDDDPPFPVNRVLVQAKEGREVAGTQSNVHKFEKRWEGNFTDENAAQNMLVTGKDENGEPLVVAQKLYKLAQDQKTLPGDGQLQLEPKYLILQKRRRTHLQLDSVGEVQTRRNTLQGEIDKLTAAGQPVPPALQKFVEKLDAQVKFLTESGALLEKYGQWMPSGEAFIVSADRYSVYDPVARQNNPPTDTDDEIGRIGRGPLHLEAEWDSASSDPFMKALDAAKEKLAKEPANAEVTADIEKLEAARQTFLKDVETTVQITKELLLAAGLEEEPTKLAKDERAAALAKGTERAQFWV